MAGGSLADAADIKQSDGQNKIPQFIVDDELEIKKFEVEIMRFKMEFYLEATVFAYHVWVYLLFVTP